MEKTEQAIRNALFKIDANDKAKRRQIYQAAWNVHEKSLTNNKTISNTLRLEKRNHLKNIILLIEAEYQPHENTEKPKTKNIKVLKDDAYSFAPKNKNLRFTLATIFGCLLLIALVSIYFFYKNTTANINDNVLKNEVFPFDRVEEPNITSAKQAFPEKSSALSQESSSIQGASIESLINSHNDSLHKNYLQEDKLIDSQTDYITVFTPNDVSGVTIKGSATITLRTENQQSFARIQANSANDAAIITIGEGALNALRGKPIIIDIDAKSEGLEPSQMAITCDLGEGVDCERHRFNVPNYRDNILLQINLPKDSKGAAKLYLTSDLLGEGHAINLYAIRLKAVD